MLVYKVWAESLLTGDVILKCLLCYKPVCCSLCADQCYGAVCRVRESLESVGVVMGFVM